MAACFSDHKIDVEEAKQMRDWRGRFQTTPKDREVYIHNQSATHPLGYPIVIADVLQNAGVRVTSLYIQICPLEEARTGSSFT